MYNDVLKIFRLIVCCCLLIPITNLFTQFYGKSVLTQKLIAISKNIIVYDKNTYYYNECNVFDEN